MFSSSCCPRSAVITKKSECELDTFTLGRPGTSFPCLSQRNIHGFHINEKFSKTVGFNFFFLVKDKMNHILCCVKLPVVRIR